MLRSYASKLEQMKEMKLKNKKTNEYLIKKYQPETRKVKEALETIKQKITFIANWIRRHEAQIMHHRQTSNFS